MKKNVILLFSLAAFSFSGELTIDLSNVDPLTSAVFRIVEEAFDLNEAGIAALKKGDYEKARQLFVKARETLPIYNEAENNLAALYFMTGREFEAGFMWENLTRKDPDYLMPWFNLALFNLKNGHVKEAARLLEIAYSKDKDHADIWSLYAYVSFASGQRERAVRILQEKIPAPAALSMLGEIYAVSGEFEKARLLLERLKTMPDGREFFENNDVAATLAAVYNELKMFDETRKLYSQAQGGKHGVSSSLRISYAWALYGQQNLEEAVRVFRQALEQNPDDRRAMVSLIYLLTQNSRFDEAKIILEKIERFGDADASVQYLRGFADFSANRFEESRKSLENALKISPDDANIKGLLAYVLINLGEEKKARELWRGLSETDARNDGEKLRITPAQRGQSLINLAVLAQRENKTDSALYFFRQSLEISENAGVRVSMGNIFFDKNLFDSAMFNYSAAFTSSQWRTKALSGAYFTALAQKNTAYADEIAARFQPSDTGDYVLRVRADFALRGGDFEKTVNFTRGISSFIAEDYLRLSLAFLGLENVSAAQNALDSAQNLNAEHSLLPSVRRQIAFFKGDYASALDGKAGDNLPIETYNRAVILFRAADYTQALNYAIIAADLFAGRERTEMVRIAANSAALTGDWVSALRWFSLLTQLEPTAQNAFNVAVAAYNENNLTLTKEFYALARQKDPTVYNSDIEARLREAQEGEKQGVASDASFSASALSKVDSLYNLALNHHLSGDTETAANLYRQLLETDKNHYRSWNNLGAIYGEAGEIEKAVSAYENAVGRRADVIDGYVNLVNIHIATGNTAAAKRWLRKGLKISPKNENLLFFKRQLGG